MADFNQQGVGSQNNQGFQKPVMMQYPFMNSLNTNTPFDNYMGRNQAYQMQQNQYLKCRPVSSKEEARAFQIDLDGSLWVFTDVSNEKIYTKQINRDGSAAFKVYALTEDTVPTMVSTEYVTKQEFNKVIQSLMAAMQPTDVKEPAIENTNNTLVGF